MIKLLKKLFADQTVDPLIEGLYADQYPRESRAGVQIKQDYQQRWAEPEINPITAPWKYDPCDPPQGWRYDPYYETWIKQ